MALDLDLDPFRLAQDMQEQIIGLPFDKRVELASHSLEYLGRSALELEALGAMYLVDCRAAFMRPQQAFGPTQRLVHFGDIAIESTLTDFAYLSIGKLHTDPIHSLSAAFRNVTLLPGLERMPENGIVYVPVLAIDQKLRTN